MKKPKIKTQYPGVRYYEHSTRKQRNGHPDRYSSIRYKKDGRTIEEGMGWGTEQWNVDKAHVETSYLCQKQEAIFLARR